MKNRTYFSTEFILSFLTVILAGCTLTVRGKYIPDENDTNLRSEIVQQPGSTYRAPGISGRAVDLEVFLIVP